MEEEPQVESTNSQVNHQPEVNRPIQTHDQPQVNRQLQVNEQAGINEQYRSTIQQLPSEMIVGFKKGEVKMIKRKYCLKFEIKFEKQADTEQQPRTIEELFPQKQEETQIKVTIFSRIIPKQIQKIFATINDLYNYLATFISNQDKVTVSKAGIQIKQEGKAVMIDFSQLKALQTARNTVQIDLDKIEDKLLQFNPRQWQILEYAADAYLNGKEISLENGYDSIEHHNNGNEVHPETNENMRNESQQSPELDFVREYAHYIAELDQDEFLEEECQINEEEYDENFQTRLKNEQQSIKQFQSRFEDLLKEYRKPTQVPPHPYPRTLPTNDERSASLKPNPSRPIQGFPPGYTPPHIAKPTAPDGLSSDQMLRLGNSNSKKEKLKLGKKMMKMGYSLEEVIQYIERLERQKKGEKKEVVFEAPSQGPVRPFHIPKTKNIERSVASQGNQANQKAVREMLIMLLREKRYKKLQDIKKHMESEGLVTTIDSLKKMIDEIRARNAQRKVQEKRQ